MTLTEIKRHITVSEGNRKMGVLPSISLPPILTCNLKAPCTKGGCYMIHPYKCSPNVLQAYSKNLVTYYKSYALFFDSISEWLTIRQPSHFRWHVAGDIPDKKYLFGMMYTALNFSSIKFLAFTKKYNLIRYLETTLKSKNLSIVISAWPGLALPKTELPIAYMQDGTEKRVPVNAIECPGNCESCGMCFELKTLGANVVFKKH